MSLTVSPSLVLPEARRVTKTLTTVAGIPLYVYAVSMASLFTIVGILWDISWHSTIGRDKFLSPPHLLIYLGAIFGGLFSGIQVLRNTFTATKAVKQTLVKIWGVFYSSLGALFCIWGAVAMLTSAPFDDWWHNTYGLDVVILSPPHAVLGLGMLFLQFGACVSIVKYLNHLEQEDPQGSVTDTRRQQRILRFLFVLAAASLLSMVCTVLNEFLDTRNQRAALFYQVVSVAVLLFLPAFYRALRLKWGMTWVAITYFFIVAGCNWVLQLFPAVPKLGPILNPVTHFQSFQFPLLLFVPALAMDLIMQKVKANDWKKAAIISIVFISVTMLVQYPFSGFLLESPASRNFFFGGDSWYYGADPNWEYRFAFQPWEEPSLVPLLTGAAIAVVIAFLISRLSLRWGRWMQRVQR